MTALRLGTRTYPVVNKDQVRYSAHEGQQTLTYQPLSTCSGSGCQGLLLPCALRKGDEG